MQQLDVKSEISWVEAVLAGCKIQAQTLQDVLEELSEEVRDNSGQKMWKKILTEKRAARTTSALHEIEGKKIAEYVDMSKKSLQTL